MSPSEVDFQKGFLVPKVVDIINDTFLLTYLIDGILAVSTQVLMERHKSPKIACKMHHFL